MGQALTKDNTARRQPQTAAPELHIAERSTAASAPEKTPVPRPIPYWAEYQHRVGIYRTLSIWAADRYLDPDELAAGREKWLLSDGLLNRTKSHPIEVLALEAIETESLVWMSARGRTWLTSLEHRVLNLEKSYLLRCSTKEFAAKNAAFAQPDADELDKNGKRKFREGLKLAWISRKTGLADREIERMLQAVEAVYELRAILGLEGHPKPLPRTLVQPTKPAPKPAAASEREALAG